MGVFVKYSSNVFADLSNVPQTILTANPNILLINSIIICNRGAQDMLFNLQKLRSQTSPITIYLVNRLPIKAYETVDVAAALGLQLFLEYTTSPSTISDSLIGFSNGYSQKYDCEITYSAITGT